MPPLRKKKAASRRESGRMPIVQGPRTAVVVDDHPGLREAIVDMLVHEGWTVRAFQSVEDALPYVRATLPDVVLTDINVGVLSGAALARELRIDRATAHLAIVAMSGTTDPSERMLSLFDDFLPKPVELPMLTRALHTAIARRRADEA